jgi:hypothetical protein
MDEVFIRSRWASNTIFGAWSTRTVMSSIFSSRAGAEQPRPQVLPQAAEGLGVCSAQKQRKCRVALPIAPENSSIGLRPTPGSAGFSAELNVRIPFRSSGESAANLTSSGSGVVSPPGAISFLTRPNRLPISSQPHPPSTPEPQQRVRRHLRLRPARCG